MLPHRPARFLSVLAVVAACTVRADPGSREPVLRSGDIVFQTSRSSQSVAIQRATGSPFSHVGLVEVGPDGAFVLEAVQPVSRTPWRSWRTRGVAGKVTVMRLPNLTAKQAGDVVSVARSFLGRPYDPAFGWDDETVYCSELVVKAFERGAGVKLGRPQRLDSLQLDGLGAALRGRFGSRVPGERMLITPASIAADPTLTKIFPTGS